jgi:hypothetical protein
MPPFWIEETCTVVNEDGHHSENPKPIDVISSFFHIWLLLSNFRKNRIIIEIAIYNILRPFSKSPKTKTPPPSLKTGSYYPFIGSPF